MNELVKTGRHIFYDRYISVTLQRKEYTGISTIFADNGTDVKSVVPVKAVQQVHVAPLRRIMLDGYEHWEFVNIAPEGAPEIYRKKLIKARGSTFKYNLSDLKDKKAFESGWDPKNSNILPVGSRLLVNENGQFKKYHIAEDRGDDSFTMKDSIIIPCPEQGLKPSITFSVNEIPGQHCYGMEVRIANMNLDIPVRQFNKLILTAGYNSETSRQKFECDIFSSYIEKPNPDGVTVFRCITCGKTDAFISNHPITVRYLGGSCTLHSMIKAVGDMLDLHTHDYLLKEYQELTILAPKNETYADNAQALLDWMRSIIIERIKYHEGHKQGANGVTNTTDPMPVVELTSDGLYVYCTNRANSDVDQDGNTTMNAGYTIPDMDAVKGASFNGVALTMQSVWNPLIRPGRVFRMRPNIINGANLPNLMSESTYGNTPEAGYLYRALTVNISFSTVGSENDMTVLAVPVQYLKAYDTDKATNLTMSEFNYATVAETKYEHKMVLELGEQKDDGIQSAASEEERRVQEQKDNANKMFNLNVYQLLGSSRGREVQIVEGDTLSDLAEKWYAVYPDLPPSGPPNYLSTKIDCNPNKLSDNTQYVGPILSNSLWPIIAVATYQKYLTAKSQNTSNNKWESFSNLMKPNDITVGKYLFIPEIPNLSGLKKAVDVFKFAVAAYHGIPGYGAWIYYWNALIRYTETY